MISDCVVQVFDESGSHSFKFGSSGNGNGQFSGPYGVTIDRRNDQIVVADTGNHRIQIFDSKGQFIRAFGSSGNGDGQLNTPYSVVVDPQGNYFVLERSNHRVSVFDSDGRVVRKFGTNGNGNGQLANPWGIGLLSNGHVVVGDHGNKRLQIFDHLGNFVQVVAAGQFSDIHQLFVDSDDNILVSNDDSSNPIRIFKSDGTLVKQISVSGQQGHGVCLDVEGRLIMSCCASCIVTL